MDLLNMTIWEKIHDLYKKVRGNFYLPSHSFEIWCFLGGGVEVANKLKL